MVHVLIGMGLVLLISFALVNFGVNRWLTIFTGVLLMFFFKIGEKYYVCRACGYKSRFKWGKHHDR